MDGVAGIDRVVVWSGWSVLAVALAAILERVGMVERVDGLGWIAHGGWRHIP